MQKEKDKEQKFDLEERSKRFSKKIIKVIKNVNTEYEFNSILRQVIRSGTSIGANYCEADEAQSKADFKYKICLCRKEARETRYWLGLILDLVVAGSVQNEILLLQQEAKELNLIFNKIVNSLNKNDKTK